MTCVRLHLGHRRRLRLDRSRIDVEASRRPHLIFVLNVGRIKCAAQRTRTRFVCCLQTDTDDRCVGLGQQRGPPSVECGIHVGTDLVLRSLKGWRFRVFVVLGIFTIITLPDFVLLFFLFFLLLWLLASLYCGSASCGALRFARRALLSRFRCGSAFIVTLNSFA